MTNVAPSEQWSKLLFNNLYVLRIAAAIDNGGDEVDSGMLQRQLSLGQSAVHRVLRVLEGVELLERLDRKSRTEPLRYRRSAHPFWESAHQLDRTAGTSA